LASAAITGLVRRTTAHVEARNKFLFQHWFFYYTNDFLLLAYGYCFKALWD
jgi:hypothetical protein